MVNCPGSGIEILVNLIFNSKKIVVFTGAGISTPSGIPDYRGPDGIWTRKTKGLPVENSDWSLAEPNAGHLALVELQKLNKLYFLISQNIDNMHLKSGINPDFLAELHGNITKLRCTVCEFIMDNFDDGMNCPLCGGTMKSSVVNFGDNLPENVYNQAIKYASECDLFLVLGSSLVVYPAADLPRVALESGAKLIIINNNKTPLDDRAELVLNQEINDILPEAVKILSELIRAKGSDNNA